MSIKRMLSMLLAFCMIVSLIPANVFAAEQPTEAEPAYPALVLGERQTAVITEGGGVAYFTFTPSVDGTYWFISYSDTDTRGYLYDADMNRLTENDDSGYAGGTNFGINYQLSANQTYILGARYYDDNNTGSFDVAMVHECYENYEEVWDPEKTCTQPGVRTSTCRICGYSVTENVDAGHSYEIIDSKEPTCTEDGFYEYCCSGCGDSYTETLKSQHVYYTEEYVAPTCTTEGYTVYVCEKGCGDRYTETLAAYDHDYWNGKCGRCGTYQEVSGQLTDTITWSLSGSDGVLHVDGSGAMPDWEHRDDQPWREYRDWIVGVEISEGITEIGSYGFDELPWVAYAQLPESLTRIGAYAFNHCYKLYQVNLPAGLVVLDNHAFSNTELQEITIPGSVTSVGRYTFGNCDKLHTVILEEGVEVLEFQAFQYCDVLENVVLPETLREIKGQAFGDCPALKSIELPGSLEYLVQAVFERCGLESIVIPASVATMTKDVFNGCTSLTFITMEAGNAIYSSVDGVLYAVYGDETVNLFILPEGLATVTVPADVDMVQATLGSKLQSMIFLGDAPDGIIGGFKGLEQEKVLHIYYPADNATWTDYAIEKLHSNFDYSTFVCFEPLQGMKILSSPSDMEVEAGQTVTLSVEAYGATDIIWQYYDIETGEHIDMWYGPEWSFVASVDQNSVTYRCVVSDGTDTLYSHSFQVTVMPVQQVTELGQEFVLDIPGGGYGEIVFTADRSGLHLINLEFDRSNYSVEMVSNVPSVDVWSEWNGRIRFLAQEGQTYTIRFITSEEKYGDTIHTWGSLCVPEEITEGEYTTVVASIARSEYLQFKPEVSGWYEVIGCSSYSLEAEDRSTPAGSTDYACEWLEAGKTYYLSFEGRYDYNENYYVTIVRPPEVQVGDTISGIFAQMSMGRYFYFTPEATGMYRFVSDNSDIDISWVTSTGNHGCNGYIELEKGVRYTFKISSRVDWEVSYEVTVEQMEMVEVGHVGTIDVLPNGQEYEFGFIPEFTDIYLVYAYAADGTRMNLSVNGNGGSGDAFALTADQLVHVIICNLNGVDLENITYTVSRQPAMELGQDTPAYVDNNGNAHLSFTPEVDGLYCFFAPGGMEIYEACGANEAMNVVNYISSGWVGGEYQSMYHLIGGESYYVYGYGSGDPGDYRNFRVEEPEYRQIGETVSVNTGAAEQFEILLNVTEAGSYYWISPFDINGGAFSEDLYQVTETGLEFVDIAHYDDDDVRYAAVWMEAGVYRLTGTAHENPVNGTVTVNPAPDAEELTLEESYTWAVDTYHVIDLRTLPSYASCENIVWQVGDSNIIVVEDYGAKYVGIRAVASGITTLTAVLPNGNKYSTTITVKAPIEVAIGETVTLEMENRASDKIVFEPEESGYYVIRISDSIIWWQYPIVENNIVLDGEHYVYVQCNGGWTYSLDVGNESGELKNVSLEIRKAEEPTELNMQESVNSFVNADVRIYYTFGSVWEFGKVEWDLTGEAVTFSDYIYMELFQEFRATQLGTATVTATCGNLSASCAVHVVDTMPLNLDETLSVDMTPWQHVRCSFTPAESGYYVIHRGAGVSMSIYEEDTIELGGGFYCDQNAAVWLEANTTYVINLHEGRGENRNAQILVEKPKALPFGEEIEFLTLTESLALYEYTPETSGYYTLAVPPRPGMEITVLQDQQQLNAVYATDSYCTYYSVWMDQGTTYQFLIVNNFEAQWASMILDHSVAPEDFHVEVENYNITVGDFTSIDIVFDPSHAMAEYTVELDDSGVLSAGAVSRNNHAFRAKKAGEATITVTCGDIVKKVTITVHEVIDLHVDETVELTLGTNMEVVKLHIPEPGYYVVRMDNNHCWYEGLPGYCASRHVDGNEYTYYYFEQTEITTRVYNNYGDPQVLHMELRKAELPTAIYLPEEINIFVGSETELNVALGSVWEFAYVRWSIEGSAAEFGDGSGMWRYIRGLEEGTATVTVTCAEVSTTCTVNVMDSLPITLDQTISMELPGWGQLRLSFTPEKTGYYTFYYGENVYSCINHESGSEVYRYLNNEGCTAHFLAGETYSVVLENSSSESRTLTVTLGVPAEFTAGELQCMTILGSANMVYQFTPEESGAYYLQNSNPNCIQLELYTWDGECLNTNWVGSNDLSYANAELTAGKTYMLLVHNYYGDPQYLELMLAPAGEPTDMWLSESGTEVLIGSKAQLWVHFEPVYAFAECTVTLDDAGVLEFYEHSGNYYSFRTLMPGTTTVTVTCGELVCTVTYTVIEPTYLGMNDETFFVIPENNCAYVQLMVEEEGYYIFKMDSDRTSFDISRSPSTYERYGSFYDAQTEATYERYWLPEGEYLFTISYDVQDDAFPDGYPVNVEARQAEVPVELKLEDVSVYVGSYFNVSVAYGSPWAFTPIRWELDSDGAVNSWYEPSMDNIGLCADSEGTATLSVHSLDGTLSAQCTIHVIGAPALEVGVPTEMTLASGSQLRATFTPEISGYYMVSGNLGVYVNIRRSNGDYVTCRNYSDQFYWWLNEGVTYNVSIGNSLDEENTFEMVIDRPETLRVGDSTQVELAFDQMKVVRLLVEKSGYYLIQKTASGSNYYEVFANDWNWKDSSWNPHYRIWLNEGEEYMLVLRNRADEVYAGTLALQECPGPDSIELGGKGSMSVVVGNSITIYAYPNPYYATVDCTWSVDENLLTIEETGPDFIRVTGKAVGNATITATDASGVVGTLTLSIVEPIVMTENQPVPLEVNRNTQGFIAFTAPRDGLYVFCLDNAYGYDFSQFGAGAWLDMLTENDSRYIYVSMQEGDTFGLTLRVYEDISVKLNAEVRQAEIPTEVILPETITSYLNNSFTVPIRFNSNWAYPVGACEYTIEGDAVQINEERPFGVWLNSVETGTATLTVTVTIGDVVLTDTCEITVGTSPVLQLGEILEITIPAHDGVSATFTPETSGIYVFQCDSNLSMNVYGSNSISNNYNNIVVVYLEGNCTYDVEIDNYSDWSRYAAVRVKTPETMTLDQSTALDMPYDWRDVTLFTPETSGYYYFFVMTGADISISNGDGMSPWSQCERWEGVTHMIAELEKGVTYFVTTTVYNDSEGYYGDIWVENPPVPDELILRGPSMIMKGMQSELQVAFEPFFSCQDVTVTISDETVLRLIHTYGSNFVFEALKAGTVTVTVSTSDGLSSEHIITVVEPQVYDLTLDEVLTVTLEPDSALMLNFAATGDFVLSVEGAGTKVIDGPITQETIREDVTYIFSRGLQADMNYPYLLTYQGNEPGTVTIKVQREAPVTSASMNVSELELLLGNAEHLEIVTEPANSMVCVEQWITSDPSVVDFDWADMTTACVFGIKAGTAVITAILENGMEVSCTVHVTTPEITAELTLDEYQEYTMEEMGDYPRYSFTAPADGSYFFAVLGTQDAIMTILDSQWDVLTDNDDYDRDHRHSGAWVWMTEGQTVIVQTGTWDQEAVCQFKTIVSTTDDVFNVAVGPELFVNDPMSMLISVEDPVSVSFVPEKTGWYAFRLEGEGAYALQSDELGGFYMDEETPVLAKLEAGTVYQLSIWRESMNGGEILFWVEDDITMIEKLEITNEPARKEFIEGFVFSDLAGLEMKVTWSDGSVTEHVFDDDGEMIGGFALNFECEEHENGTATITLSAGDATVTYTVSIIENPVVKIEVVDDDVLPWVEGAGQLDYGGGPIYSKHHLLKDIKFKVTYVDGSSEIVSMDEDVYGYYVESGEYVIEGLGGTNVIVFNFLDLQTEPYTIQFIESDVEKIEVIKEPDVLTLGQDDRVLYEDNTLYFHHDWGMGFKGMVIRITYTDGITEDITYADLYHPERDDPYYRFPELNGYGVEVQYYMPEYNDQFAYWSTGYWMPVEETGEVAMILHHKGQYATFTLKISVEAVEQHNYESVVTEPTCTEQGYTTHTCTICGDSYVDSRIDALGHNYESVVTKPTYTEKGYTTHTCTVCGDSYIDSYTDCLVRNGWLKQNNNWYYYENGVMKTGWVKVNNNWYYLDAEGVMQTGWVQVRGNWYYLNSAGIMQTGWLTWNNKKYYLQDSGIAATGLFQIDGKYYYFASGGSMLTGWQTIDGTKHLFSNDGPAVTGWYKTGGSWYYMQNNGAMTTGWLTVNNNRYYLNAAGVMQTGWVNVDNNWYYLNSGGIMQTGWLTLNDRKYYLQENGVMVAGLAQIDGEYYCFAIGGAMQTGWQTIDGVKHLFSGDGTAVTGWYKENGNWYYLKNTGAMTTGWLTLNNKKYYLQENGVMVAGLAQIDGKYYCFATGGSMQTGWQTINGTKHLFSNDGPAVTGWYKENGNWYYLKNTGAMTTGWVKVNNNWYYLNAEGIMQTGWLTWNNKKYYLQDSGIAATGLFQVAGKYYYFTSGGSMLTGWQSVNGVKHLFGNDGPAVTGWYKENGSWYYLKNTGAISTGWVKTGGYWYYLNAEGIMQTGWLKVNNKWYYLNQNGVMMTGWLKTGGYWYYLGDNGVMVTGTQVINGKTYYFNSNGVWIE